MRTRSFTHRALSLLILGMGSALASGFAMADNVLGFYAGGAVGQSHVRDSAALISSVRDFDEQHSAWKVMVGLRPISWIGAEFAYLDFGKPNANSIGGSAGVIQSTRIDEHSRAQSLFGVLYLPIPVPRLDIFAKAGYANVTRDVTVTNTTTLLGVGTCPVSNPGCAVTTTVTDSGRNDKRPAYGAGAQVKLWHISVRAEYERISVPDGDPDLVSLGAIYRF
jgi:hypothetical protein